MLGIGGIVVSCGGDADTEPTQPTEPTRPIRSSGERVIIIGAGAAGMTAAHLLVHRGVDVRVLEATSTYGGRIKHLLDFVDFPIPLGAEWLHVEREVLAHIVDDDSVDVATMLRGYESTDEVAMIVDGELVYDDMGDDYEDLKFVGSSWLDFFNEYIVDGIADRMVFDAPVRVIDYSGDVVSMTDAHGEIWEADRVIVTVPMKILQDGDIEFVPPLPDAHVEALAAANIWTGMKVFIEFSERFYPVFVEFAADRGADGQRAYYDAAYAQDSDSNVLGLFLVGELAEPYQALDEEDELIAYILAELDAIFDGAASRTYVQHVVQNWANEPFAKAAYLEDYATADIPNALAQTLAGRVFFAGDGYTREDDWSAVHNAVRAARAAVDEMYG